MNFSAGDSSTVASVCGDAEAIERSLRIERECEELRATSSYLKQRLKLVEGSESTKEHTTNDEAQLVALLRRLRASGFESSRTLLLLFWKIIGSAIRARKEASLVRAEVVSVRNRLREIEAAKSELAHAHTDEIDALKKQHRRELRKMSEEMMTNNSEAELRKEMAEMAVKSRESEISRLRNDMAKQWKRCWVTDTERFEFLWEELQALRLQNEVLAIRDRLLKDLVKETSSNQKNEHRMKQLWAKLSAADRRITDSTGSVEQKQLLQKAVEDRVRVYETRIADLERERLGDELNPQAVAELQERVVNVEAAKSKLENEKGMLEKEVQAKTEKLLRIEREQERTSTAMREALDAALQEKARLITDLDIYNEQLSANEALRELLMMAKIEPLELPRTAP
ncbi:Leucine-rich repeat-containing protein, putative [Perkinsus marinus ATCC 50983]|uniref:Leucine-rich repeat-containing protein, putative n=1 Tax=Perkinsus marinus (strain ATCC 50983 / TXsc) TaxID=423536 RepID=C5LU94_PERM5|nr:Leucine-rich repeat-containing protein, putative [Perkinsus marinus ATCC 50983]EEQ99627.1 Leucine-rich repeat-containing protein, putative [Perkinsus marinus ATCC 50983]|eukprot:XP_002766910.1 Leucine-rich repeat-containing protein, putative [Perkinsus marinus ATCC 50983]